MSVIKFIRDIARYFKYPSDDQPTTQQDYQNAVKNWVATEESLVDSVLWQPTTRYETGNVVKTPSIPSQYCLVCTTAGTSDESEPTYTDVSVGDSVTDGSVTWRVDKAVTTQTDDKEFSIVSSSTDSNATMGFGMESTEPLARLCDTGVQVRKSYISFYVDKNEKFQIHTGGATTLSNNFFVGGKFYNYGGLIRVGSDGEEPNFGGWLGSVSNGVRLIAGEGFGYQTGGGRIELWSKGRGGAVEIHAYDGSNDSTLKATAAGGLTWKGLDINPQTLTTVTFDEKNVATSTLTNLGNFTLTKGTWLITVSVAFANNSNGYRHVIIGNSTSSEQINRCSSVTYRASENSTTHIVFSIIHAVSSSTKLYLNVSQNSGSTLGTTNNGVRLFRLSHDA